MSEQKINLPKSIDFEKLKKENLEFTEIYDDFKEQDDIKFYINKYSKDIISNPIDILSKIKLCHFWIKKTIYSNLINPVNNGANRKYLYCIFGSINDINSKYENNFILFLFFKKYDYYNRCTIEEPKLFLSPSFDYIDGILATLDLCEDFLKFQDKIE